MKKFLLLSVVLLSIVGCMSNSSSSKYVKESVGQPYEMFVVAPVDAYRGAMGDSLRSVLAEEVLMINFPEPTFNLFNIAPDNFKGINMNHRNLLFLQIGSDYPVAKMFTLRDKYSKPQVITVLEAPDTMAMMQLILDERYKVRDAYEQEELARFAVRAKQYDDAKLSDEVLRMFDLSLKIPKGYTLRNIVGDDFMWISHELPESSQGIVIYDYPCDETVLADSSILSARNNFVARIPGELPGGYMTTAYEFTPETGTKIINGREWYVTRGFWRVENDFQGGPFVSFSTIDILRKRVVAIDCYVYSPNPSKKQRNFLKQLEGIVETAEIK